MRCAVLCCAVLYVQKMSKAEIDNLWDIAMTKLKALLSEQFGYITDVDSFLEVASLPFGSVHVLIVYVLFR